MSLFFAYAKAVFLMTWLISYFFFFRKTLQIAKQLSDKALEAQACYSLGNTYILLKDSEKAIEFLTKHFKIAQELEDRVGMGWLCWSLGNTPTTLGKNEEAIKFASKHLEISREVSIDGVGGQSRDGEVVLESRQHPHSIREE